MIHIVNKRNRPYKIPVNTPIFSVDRSSPLGNPFFMKLEAQRDEVCDQYEQYFRDTLDENVNKYFLAELDKLVLASKQGDIALACWCYPKRCHAETIKRAIESAVYHDGKWIIPNTGGIIRRRRYIVRLHLDLPPQDAVRLVEHFINATGEDAYFTDYFSPDPFAPREYGYMFYTDSDSKAQLIADDLYNYLSTRINVSKPTVKPVEES